MKRSFLLSEPGRPRSATFAAALTAALAEHERGTPPRLLLHAARADPRELVRRAAFHRVLNFVFVDLREATGVDPAILSDLERHYTLRSARHLRSIAELATFGQVMDGAGIPWLTFKGAVLSELVYERPDLRTYGDIDVLVPHSVYADAIKVLEAAGFELLDRNWGLIRREGRGQLHIRMPLGTVADVHWHLLNRGVVRDALSIPLDNLFERAREVDVNGALVRTFDAVDTIVHLCVHAALSGGHRLLWFKDIERAIAAVPPAWDQVTDRAMAWRASSLVGISLLRTRQALGTPVPPAVIRALMPSAARRAISAGVDAAWPAARSVGRVTPAVVWCQATRNGGGATTAALALRLARHPVALLTGADADRAAGPGILAPTGDESTRAAFLEEVTRAEAKRGPDRRRPS